MQEVESKFASFCCALACNSQLNVWSYVNIWAFLATRITNVLVEKSIIV